MYEKVRCTCRVVVLLIKSIAFLWHSHCRCRCRRCRRILRSHFSSLAPIAPTFLIFQFHVARTITNMFEKIVGPGTLVRIINNYWMRLSIIWRIMEIEEGVIRRWRITASEISKIHQMIRKLNLIIVLFFNQNTVKPLLNGHLWDLPKCPLNRGL